MRSKRLCDSERNAGASRPYKTEPRSSGRSFVILGGSLKLDATLAPKGVSRTPRTKEALSEDLRIRFRLRRDSGKSGLENKSRGVLIRFRMKQFD
ncbi:hypothetical protein MRB53_023503 [Persea americana]|uniref:Uncharacterized protein n=1 Tax=Persea americana TaxID=3435 RepID=A0ACC2L9S0_PERAE|nr:hypothetical protein MRB53_023503 [Persea americana]